MSLLSKYINRQLAAYQSELVQTHYQEVENMYRQIRGWRHDYRNHIQVLKSYAKDGDLAQISKYLDELDEDLSTVDTVIKTGNKMTDAILNSKISLAKSKHIPVVADAHVPVALKTSEMDLCIIIGNLFDNAIEASLQLPEEKRMIRIYMDMKNTQLYMSFTNFTATKKQKKISGRFHTTKGQGHGCGHHDAEENHSCGCGSHEGTESGEGCRCGCGERSKIEGANVGKTLKVHYTGTFNDGTKFDSSYDRGEPLEFVCGAGMMIKGFDRAVADMEIGQIKDIHLMPEEAYGLPDPNAIFHVEISQLPGAEELEEGQQVYLQNEMGQPFPVTVVAKEAGIITFDANHEMAGKELNFKIELVEIC
jgi:FKBP-type peptidyl-prolyl cis-trans isomerase 2